MDINVMWFRRDLRLEDNAALYHALKDGTPVMPLFIFDKNILDQLQDKHDKRVQFIHDAVAEMHSKLVAIGSSMVVKYGSPTDVWKALSATHSIKAVFANHDDDPYALQRDDEIKKQLAADGIAFNTYKDHVIFERKEVSKDDGKPYTVFTPYSRKWKAALNDFHLKAYPTNKYFANFARLHSAEIPSLESMGFAGCKTDFPPRVVQAEIIKHSKLKRDLPAVRGTSRLGVHLRFGTLSIRKLAAYAKPLSEGFLNELIWRDFYHMILHHFPHVGEGKAFKKEYDAIVWRNNEAEFEAWCQGKTGYPMVDAGMRELNATGFMHNRVRMVTASFLVKHLLIDWRWGEAYFAAKLLDYDLAANNGGWQWAASSGCDAAPYFRVFNPTLQQEKFDPEEKYIREWIPEFGTDDYSKPVVDHKFARERVLKAYKDALG